MYLFIYLFIYCQLEKKDKEIHLKAESISHITQILQKTKKELELKVSSIKFGDAYPWEYFDTRKCVNFEWFKESLALIQITSIQPTVSCIIGTLLLNRLKKRVGFFRKQTNSRNIWEIPEISSSSQKLQARKVYEIYDFWFPFKHIQRLCKSKGERKNSVW